MSQKPFDDTPYTEMSAHSDRVTGAADKAELHRMGSILAHCVNASMPMAQASDYIFMAAHDAPISISGLAPSQGEAFKGLEELIESVAGEDDELVMADSFYCNCGETTAKAPGAKKVTCHECGWRWTKNEHDSDWSHESPLTPHGEWLASLKVGDRVKLQAGERMYIDPSVRGADAVYEYVGHCIHMEEGIDVRWPNPNNRRDPWHRGVCHESQLVKP